MHGDSLLWRRSQPLPARRGGSLSNRSAAIETRSLPALARSYPRRFTFYLGNPFPRFLDSWFESLAVASHPLQPD